MAKRTPITSGRARRAIKMGELASQVGSSYLWNQLRRPFLSAPARERELLETHIRNAQRIVEGSKQLRGAFMKLIQMLSIRKDLLPGEALDVLRATQSSVPPMSYATISEQIRKEIGKRPEAIFRSFDQTAFAAASLGQVHRAVTRDGLDVAVKIQYPGVEDTVEQDLQNLKLLLRTLQALGHDVMRQQIDTAAVYKELELRLREELDYVNEARNIVEFGRRLGADSEIMIPRYVKELSSRRVLTMTRRRLSARGRDGPRSRCRTARMGRGQDSRIRVAPDPRVWTAAHGFSSGQLFGEPSSALGRARLRLDSPLSGAGAQGQPAGRARDSERRRQIARGRDGQARLPRSESGRGADGPHHPHPVRTDAGGPRRRSPGIRHRRQGDQGGRAGARESPLQIPRAQRLPDSRAGRPRRNHSRPGSEDQLPPNLRRLHRANPRMSARERAANTRRA